MSIARDRLRWNGWGYADRAFPIPTDRESHVLGVLARHLGREPAPAEVPVALESVRPPPSKLPADVLAALRAACGEDGVRTSATERITHATGRSLPDLLRLRRGEVDPLPEVVVYPPDEGAVAAVLRIASAARLAVVPFGGGTSVVGGVSPLFESEQVGVVCLDTTRLDALVRVDPVSLTATFQAGIDGPALEAALAEHGLTLGHYPQSFEHSTLGGWIATRSCGQQSDGYGSIARLLVGVRMVTPDGVLRTVEVPHSAAGPDLGQLVLGSEGILGVVVEATLRVRPAPAASDFRGFLCRHFRDGVEGARSMAQEGVGLSMVRLSDAAETDLALALRAATGSRWDPGRGLLAALARLGYGAGRSVLLTGAEGPDARSVRRATRRARALARHQGAFPLGRAPGRTWVRDRFLTPYLRDWLLDRGVAVDTMETALPWSAIPEAHEVITRGLRATLIAHAGGGRAMAHLSHSYPDGASLYFTVLYPLDASRGVEQWQAIKRDATEAILAAGGTLSHHHGVGVDHQPWIVREKGAVGMTGLRALKRALDPHGLLNPRKIL